LEKSIQNIWRELECNSELAAGNKYAAIYIAAYSAEDISKLKLMSYGKLGLNSL